MFGISGIKGGWDSVICNGRKPISSTRRGLMMFINNTVSPLM